MPNTFMLTWNPTKWEWSDADYAKDLKRIAAGKIFSEPWSTGSRRSGIVPGDRAFLLRQHSERGIISSGRFTSKIYKGPHWDNSGRDAYFADIDWDVMVHTADRLPVETLLKRVSGVAWDNMQGSGVSVGAANARKLEALWLSHLEARVDSLPGELDEEPDHYEGGSTKVLVNRYERNPRARQECIDRWGATCFVCQFNFESTYGKLGKGFIHVHHLVELSSVKDAYVVDPIKDLRPVCANCHAMLHRRRPALSIAALKKRLNR